jgi:hypothetical protein
MGTIRIHRTWYPLRIPLMPERVELIVIKEFMPEYPAFLNASKEDFETNTAYTAKTGVRFDDGGYMVSLEMFHQIHCLVGVPSFQCVSELIK